MLSKADRDPQNEMDDGGVGPFWRAGRQHFDLGRGGVIMGILNTTPDSFSDGGVFVDLEVAVRHAVQMADEGAKIIDVGGESTRPGAADISVDEELSRVMPVILALREIDALRDVAISIDTSKAAVAASALASGADVVNDVTGLSGDPEMVDVVAEAPGVGLVIMHMLGKPRTMQRDPQYTDVVAEVGSFFVEQGRLAQSGGISADQIVFDPGIGFGKTTLHNQQLLSAIPELSETSGRPLLIGVSRKSLFAKLAGAESIENRLWPTVAMSSYCRELGAGVFRVHDVRPNAEAVKMTDAMLSAG